LQLLALAVVGSYPPLVNYLPQRTSLLSDAGPPPKNPKLQYCLEQFVSDKLLAADETIQVVLYKGMDIDISILPDNLQSQARGSFDDGLTAIGTLRKAFNAEDDVFLAASAYRPQLRLVRGIEKNLRDLTVELKVINQDLNRLSNNEGTKSLEEGLKEKRIGILTKLSEIETSFPKGWDETYSNFSRLVNVENKARLTYRRQADNSYGGIKDIVNIINGYEELLQLKPEIDNLRHQIDVSSPEFVAAEIKLVVSKIGRISGVSKIKSLLKKSRKALKKKKVIKEKVLNYYNQAILEYNLQLAWMLKAKETVSPGFEVYLNAISDTLGARLQETLPRHTALYITSCTSGHRDISLNF